MSNEYLLFVGSYTDFDILAHLPNNDKVGKGVYCFHFCDGKVKPLATISSLNPAVLSLHPSHAETLYVLAEGIKENGQITKVKYAMDNQNGLSVIECNEKTQTNGKSLCYFKVDPVTLQYGVAINYWDGSVDVYKMNEKNGSILSLFKHISHMDIAKSLHPNGSELRRQVINREDHWENRQCGPHAHSAHFYKDWVFIPDLGENAIFQYRFNAKKGQFMEFEAQLKLPKGAGPRHCVFHPKLSVIYLSNELNSSISVLSIDESERDAVKCRLKMLQNIDTSQHELMEEDVWKKNYVAEIGISFDGDFVYCSNRGLDTLAVFKVQSDGTLSAINYVSTFGKTPRHFAISPDNKWLIGANQDSNNLVVFERNIKNGNLQMHKKYDDIVNAPNFVLFAPISTNKKEQSNNQRYVHLFGAIFAILCGILLKVAMF